MKYKIVEDGGVFKLQCMGFCSWKGYIVRGFYGNGSDWNTSYIFQSLNEAEKWIEEHKPDDKEDAIRIL